MRRESTLIAMVSLCVLTAMGTAAYHAWNRPDVTPAEVGANLTTRDPLRNGMAKRYADSKSAREADARRSRDLQKKVREIKEKLLAEFPALRVEEHPVPDEQNAFLMLWELGSQFENGEFPLSKELQGILNGSLPWDAEAASRCLAEHSDLINRLEAIAALETRSSANMPANYNGFIGARAFKTGSDLLMLKARLAAEAGDEAEALRLVSVASNLGLILTGIESPTLLVETVSVLLDLNASDAAFKNLLPAIGPDADLSQWRSALAAKNYSSADFAHTIRGEWDTCSEFMFLPVLVAEAEKGALPDADATAHAFTAWHDTCVTRLASLSLEEMGSAVMPDAESAQLSPGGQELLSIAGFGLNAWTKGYLRAATVNGQRLAALELLMLEQAGNTLTAADTAALTRDPVTGQAFAFDPGKRELVAPPTAKALKVEPLVLPW